MEPVPETERMEEFRSSPLPGLRLQNTPTPNFSKPLLSLRSASDPDGVRKAPFPRRSADPTSPVSPSWAPPQLPYRPRTTSPLSGSHAHMRSRSTASASSGLLPAMGRTQSMPGVNGAGHLQFRRDARRDARRDPRSASPTFHLGPNPNQRPRPPALTMRTPKKSLIEDAYPSSPTRMSVIHDGERPLHERSSSPAPGLSGSTHTHTPLASIPDDGGASALGIVSQPLARTRRPVSPYRRVSPGSGPTSAPAAPSATTSSSTTPGLVSASSSSSSSSPNAIETIPEVPADPAEPFVPTPTSSTASSPLYRPTELLSAPSYSSLSGLSALSSVPSTPTSTRSRSPSISSLETIPDSPDAEEAAVEAERVAQLKAAAESCASDDKNKDALARGRTLAFGSRDKRKRWSVCGAERRGDLDLETIWEV